MNTRISDQDLAALIKDSLESPPEALREQVMSIPARSNYGQSWSIETRMDSLLGILTGMIGLWFFGIFFLYRNQLKAFITDIASFPIAVNSIYTLLPIAGLIALFLVFSKYLSPGSQTCGGEPC